MFQSGLPLCCWGECVQTNTYLINRVPSLLLKHKTSYEMLTQSKPKYDHLCTFGCLCYVSTTLQGRHMFASRSIACVFIGYPLGYKAYKLLDLASNQVLISRHVIFHKNVFLLVTTLHTTNCSSFFPDSLLRRPMNDHEHITYVPTTSSTLALASPTSIQSRPHRSSCLPSYLNDYQLYYVDIVNVASFSTAHPLSLFVGYSKLCCE